MPAWLVALLCGIAGAGVGELLDMRASLTHLHQYPWEVQHGRIKRLGLARYALLAAVNVILGAASAAVVYGGSPGRVLSIHAVIGLGAAGLAAPAVLQKLGRAIKT
jgi:hypothetical protein